MTFDSCPVTAQTSPLVKGFVLPSWYSWPEVAGEIMLRFPDHWKWLILGLPGLQKSPCSATFCTRTLATYSCSAQLAEVSASWALRGTIDAGGKHCFVPCSFYSLKGCYTVVMEATVAPLQSFSSVFSLFPLRCPSSNPLHGQLAGFQHTWAFTYNGKWTAVSYKVGFD